MRKLASIVFVLCVTPGLLAQASSMQASTTVLASAQLQHLNASPVQIAAAPGPGELLNLVSVVAQYKSGGAPYVIPADGQFSFELGGAPIQITLVAKGFIDQSANQVQMNTGSHGGTQASMENQPLSLTNDGDAEWTGGDGTVIVTAYYTVVDLQ